MNVTSLTPEQRESWDQNRVRMNRNKKLSTYAMLCFIAGAVSFLIMGAVDILIGIATENIKYLFIFLCELALLPSLFIGIYGKKIPPLVIAGVLWLSACILKLDLTLLAVPPAVGLGIYTAREWNQLQFEDGFPHFEIDLLENTLSVQTEQSIRDNIASGAFTPEPSREEMKEI